MDEQTTPGGSTLTNQGAGIVTFTAGMNQTAEVRGQTYNIKLDDNKSQSFTITQEPSTLSPGSPVTVGATPTTGTISFTATPDLSWNATSNNVDWLATTASGTTTATTIPVPFSTTATNPLTTPRGGSITVRAGDPILGPTGTLSITQAGSTAAGSTVGVVAEPTPGTATFTATPGLSWTATSNVPWITVATPGGGPTVEGNNTITFNTIATNPQDYVRPGTITVIAGGQPGSPTGTITVNQNPSVFGAAGATALIPSGGGNAAGSVTATTGLSWTIDPITSNGITVNPASGSGNAPLTFTAPAYIGNIPRTGMFTVWVSGAVSPGRMIQIQATQEGMPVVTVTVEEVKNYRSYILNRDDANLNFYPPFNYDGGQSGRYGYDIHGSSVRCELNSEYSIEVEKTDNYVLYLYPDAITYCKNKGAGWRVPTIIELRTMYHNRSTLQNYGFTPFKNDYYWSSSVFYSGFARCIMEFGGGYISQRDWQYSYIRCVREIN